MVINQIEVNDINFPLSTTGGKAVSNTVVASSKKIKKN